MIHEGAYVVAHPKGSINKYSVASTGDMLSDTMRMNLGILKLAEDGSFIPEVGYRYDSTRFFVMTEEV